jgi:hypothetical protein
MRECILNQRTLGILILIGAKVFFVQENFLLFHNWLDLFILHFTVKGRILWTWQLHKTKTVI